MNLPGRAGPAALYTGRAAAAGGLAFLGRLFVDTARGATTQLGAGRCAAGPGRPGSLGRLKARVVFTQLLSFILPFHLQYAIHVHLFNGYSISSYSTAWQICYTDVDTCPFMGPLIRLFWTSDISSGFQSQNGQTYLHLAEAYVMYIPSDSPLMPHLLTSWRPYGLFTLPGTDPVTDSDLDSKPDGYIALRRNCSHCTDTDLDYDPDPNSPPPKKIVAVPTLGMDICHCLAM